MPSVSCVYFAKMSTTIERGPTSLRESSTVDLSYCVLLRVLSSSSDKDELEKFIKLLITDHVLRKKFPGRVIPFSQEILERADGERRLEAHS